MSFFISLFTFLCILIKFGAFGIDVNCQFGFSNLGYSCRVDSITTNSLDDVTIDRIIGVHESDNKDEDVLLFHSFNATFNFFPQSLEKFFPNLQYIYIAKANISMIKSEDLKPFSYNLRHFYLEDNNIEVIDSDLFDFTPNIERIDFDNNKIKLVGKRAFSKLKNLSKLFFSNNQCFSGNARDKLEVFEIIAEIDNNCDGFYESEIEKFLNFKNGRDFVQENDDDELNERIQRMREIEEEILEDFVGKKEVYKDITDLPDLILHKLTEGLKKSLKCLTNIHKENLEEHALNEKKLSEESKANLNQGRSESQETISDMNSDSDLQLQSSIEESDHDEIQNQTKTTVDQQPGSIEAHQVSENHVGDFSNFIEDFSQESMDFSRIEQELEEKMEENIKNLQDLMKNEYPGLIEINPEDIPKYLKNFLKRIREPDFLKLKLSFDDPEEMEGVEEEAVNDFDFEESDPEISELYFDLNPENSHRNSDDSTEQMDFFLDEVDDFYLDPENEEKHDIQLNPKESQKSTINQEKFEIFMSIFKDFIFEFKKDSEVATNYLLGILGIIFLMYLIVVLIFMVLNKKRNMHCNMLLICEERSDKKKSKMAIKENSIQSDV